MRIALESHELLISHFTGVGRYVFELGRHLQELEPGTRHVLPLHRIAKHPRIRHHNVKNIRYIPSWGPWPKYDILHLTAGKNMRVPGNPPAILTVHDFWEFVEIERGQREKLTNSHLRVLELLKIVDGVICVSKSTENDFRHFFPDLQIPTSVIHHGVSLKFTRSEENEMLRLKKEILPNVNEYLLYLGNFHSRKNLPALISAYAAIEGRKPTLVLAGNSNLELRNQLANQADKLGIEKKLFVQLDYLSNTDLVPLISGARGFVFVPFYEGFGLPLIESYCCGTPVVCAHNSSLIELAHPSSPMVDAADIQSIANGIRQLLSTPITETLRESLIAHGKTFSWEKCAQATRQFYRQIIDEKNRSRS